MNKSYTEKLQAENTEWMFNETILDHYFLFLNDLEEARREADAAFQNTLSFFSPQVNEDAVEWNRSLFFGTVPAF